MTDRLLESLRRDDPGPDVSDVIPLNADFVTFSQHEIERLRELADD